MNTATDVTIIGGGPAGLTCAVELSQRGIQVRVLERELEAGGIPRHTDHTGFGLRDQHRILRGPTYARRLLRQAAKAGVEVVSETMVTGWGPANQLLVTSPAGRHVVQSSAVVLATGCRERSRASRMVAGARGDGVLTTGALQQMIQRGVLDKRGWSRAIVVGAEHVSFSAVLALAHAGIRTVAITTAHSRHQTHPVLRFAAARGIPVLTETDVAALRGSGSISGVELRDSSGLVRILDCDVVVFTGDWIPENELARHRGLDIDDGTLGPRVDSAFRTSEPGVFAIGNLVHPAESASVAALDGKLAAPHIANFLRDGAWRQNSLGVRPGLPLLWVFPSMLAIQRDGGIGPVPHDQLLFRVGETIDLAYIEVKQGDETLWRGRRRRLVPNRPVRVPTSRWLKAVDPSGPSLEVRVLSRK